ncbi:MULTISPECIES: hypothetical protein [unclassified Sulfurimonas]|uniref:hypothetical protein n=1 Tax=unclassified Sulfurimonas TaxID=2623549 RepID=UPI0025FBDE0D|nr:MULTISPECIES: hypothetical protein [unclassified Sulfurimonas]
MVYSYNEKNKQLKSISVPKLKGNDAQQVEKSKAPKLFLRDVMAIKLNIIRD